MPAEQQQDQISFLLSDFNARLRDTEEKNRILKERIILLGSNILTLKDQLDSSLDLIKKDLNQTKKDIGNIKTFIESIISETSRFVRKDEIIPVERMLKDFQPLEFARTKDIEQIIDNKILTLKGSLGPEKKELSKQVNIDAEIEKRISKLKESLENEIKEKLKSIKELPIHQIEMKKLPELIEKNETHHEPIHNKTNEPTPHEQISHNHHEHHPEAHQVKKVEHKHIKDRIDYIMNSLNLHKHTNKKTKIHKK